MRDCVSRGSTLWKTTNEKNDNIKDILATFMMPNSKTIKFRRRTRPFTTPPFLNNLVVVLLSLSLAITWKWHQNVKLYVKWNNCQEKEAENDLLLKKSVPLAKKKTGILIVDFVLATFAVPRMSVIWACQWKLVTCTWNVYHELIFWEDRDDDEPLK